MTASTGGARRAAPPDIARSIAWRVLRAVDDEGAYANLKLPALLRHEQVEQQDAAFATELTYGTLRWRGRYDAVIGRCVDRPLDALDPGVLDVLRLGCHQLFSMSTPDHAAVSTSVDLVRASVGPAPAGLVNAVMRRLASQSIDKWLADAAPDDSIASLAVRYSHPEWIVERFASLVGNGAELRALLEADNAPAEVTLVARPGRATVGELIAAGATPGRWSPLAAVWPHGDPGQLPQVASGAAGVQDEGSQLVTMAFAYLPLEIEDTHWLDLCAGPGGKAALLGAFAMSRGAQVTAVEAHAHRADLVRKVVGENVDVVVADGTAERWGTAEYDRVLLDAPCSGLGALRRRPESRWRKRPGDLAALVDLQQRLLSSALQAVRAGGVVGYVTCSPLPEETDEVVRTVVGDSTDVEYVDVRPLLPGVPDLGEGPDVQLWPHRHGTDAMYIALLRRIG